MKNEKASKPNFNWIKAALMDRGLQQTDLAKAWGVDEAVVSRFINTGVPKLTFDRMVALSTLLEISFDELRLRVTENVPLGKRGAPAAASKDQALAALKEAVASARRAMPDATIDVQISYKREEKL